MGSNGHATDMKQGLSLEDKVDAILEALVEIQEITSVIPEMSETIETMSLNQDELIEALRNIGIDNEGFAVEKYDS